MGESHLILYGEDETAHAELITRLFRENNINDRIIHIDDGQKVLDYLYHKGDYCNKDTFPLPDIILLDLRLPKVNGLEILRTIKADKILKCIPVAILSTSEADFDIAQAYQSHANCYLVKPLDLNKFSEMLQAFGTFWMKWNKYSNRDEK